MEPKDVARHNPEQKIQDALMAFMRLRHWGVFRITGNKYQSGLPDLFASHVKYGVRWIEVKLPGMKGSKFTPRQLEVFPKLIAHGSHIWILTAATQSEYDKLFLEKEGNVHKYVLLK